MANINITQIRMKRGNTAASSTYTGPLGELLVDTGLKTIRVQDGVTPGGMSILATNAQVWALSNSISTIAGVDTTLLANAATQQSQINTFNANLGSFQAYANSTFVAGNYSNTNVSAYLSGQNITSANIGAFQTYANLNISELQSNASTQTVDINLVNANVTAANAAITSLQSNAATQAGILDTLTANAATQSTVLDTLISNAATQASTLTTLLSNAATQQTSLTDLLANAATQADSINTLQTQVYANANVADYLPTYTGNIAGNIVKSGYTWTFSNTGTTTFPTGVRLSNARGANTVNFTTDVDKSFQIETQTNATSKLWNFTTDGNLTLPQNANINFANGVSILAGITGTYGNANVAAYLPTYSGAISANIAKNGYTWQFGTNGTTQFPGSQILAPAGESITMQSDQYSQLMWENANVTVAPNMAINSNFYVAQNNATLDIGYRDGSSTQLIKSWLWSVDGGMSFPDTTTQYTAFSNAAVATYLSNYDGGINFTASPAVITGLGNISSANFTFANGVNILSTVGAGAYGNTQVATYLLHFDGDIEFTSSTAKIGNVDVITVGDHIRSPAYQFSNGTSIFDGITGGGTTYSNANVATFLAAYGSNTISTTGNITAGNLIGNISITGNVSGNTAGFTIGYRDIPQVSFTGNATLAATDAGKHYYSTLATANVLTIANNTSVSWSVGTAVTIVNRGSGNITVAQGSGVSLYLAGNSTASNRTVTTYGMATLLNVAANVWMINGTGVS